MDAARASGILLHPTSLPGPHGVGEFGDGALRFLDFLHAAGQRLWQVLPLNPVDAGGSPYQSCSAFAGTPLLIATDRPIAGRLLEPEGRAEPAGLPAGRVDYGAAARFKEEALRRAYARFRPGADFAAFRARQAPWLDDYALFMALKAHHGGAAWGDWPAPLARRQARTLARARRELVAEIEFHRFCQFLFFAQYGELKREAHRRGIRIVGDLPIFVAYDSADVWANRGLFALGRHGRPAVVAGVPPDYFSATGQLWGNPLYRWDAMAEDGYRWWLARLRQALELYDLVRLDHFRGFAAHWEVPAGETTAVNGRWVAGPGAAFFAAARAELGRLPLIAEDLGVITPDVEALRDRFGLPGMKVLQFAFSDPASPYLPHNYVPNCVVYTGTHDNDTARGWWASAARGERALARRYLGRRGGDIAWDLIRLAWGSVARLAVAPLQDVLSLGPEARMNRPGTVGGNWAWRYDPTALTPALAARLRDLTALYGRA